MFAHGRTLAVFLLAGIAFLSCDGFFLTSLKRSIVLKPTSIGSRYERRKLNGWVRRRSYNDPLFTTVNGEISSDSSTKSEEKSEEKPEEKSSTQKEKPSYLHLEPVPPASHTIETDTTDPFNPIHTLTIHLGAPGHPHPLIFQTGKIGRQASSAFTLTRGSTILYTTTSHDPNPSSNLDFIPLSVEHQERFSSAGTTSGSFNRRDGRPAENEILTCRLMDRPIRPLIHEGWRHETQILSWVLSYDGERNCDPLAITGGGMSVWCSSVPMQCPISAVEVGYIGMGDDESEWEFVVNPTNEQMEHSKLKLTIAGTKDAVLMIEGAADFVSEEIMIQAVQFGHGMIKYICKAMEEFGEVVGKEKKMDTLVKMMDGLQDKVDQLASDDVDDMLHQWSQPGMNKKSQGDLMIILQKRVVDEISKSGLYEEGLDCEKDVFQAFKTLLCRRIFHRAKTMGIRCDGRKLDEIRKISAETGILPSVHGSALFTRGETQAIATATLGDSGMKQKMDTIDGMDQKRFYLQYVFPPSCVGETGRVGAPGRREVGHGNLAERALIPTIPSETTFPYSIRVESLITESQGSSSMASVCGGCLALMDAGVPIHRPVAGIAMGMLLDEDKKTDDAIILSDILGTEDGLGMMDFKVAGDREGISTFQLDIKCEGLSIEIMTRALEQARKGRLFILDKMGEVLEAPRKELPESVPKMGAFGIPVESIGKVIGPGGKQIRAVIEDFDLVNMDIDDDGNVQLTSMNATRLEEATAFVQSLVCGGGGGDAVGRGGRGPKPPRPVYVGPEPEVGAIYKGKIKNVHQFGVFLEILPGAEDGSTPGLEGLCHVSELHVERVRNCERFVASLGVEELEVKYIGKNQKGQVQLSRKAVLMERNGKGKRPPPQRKDGTRGPKVATKKKVEPPSTMSEDEVDVIRKAIETEIAES